MEKSLSFLGYDTYSILSNGKVRDLRTGNLHDGYYCKGYRRINLTNPQGHKSFLVHRLVGLAFLESIEGRIEIDHINRNGLDNRLENLRWADDCIQSQNRNFTPNQLGEKYIHFDCNQYKVQITRNYMKVFNKRFPTLAEAVKARDEFLKG